MLAAGLAFAEGSDSAPKWSKPRRLASAPMGMGISISQLIPRVGRGEVDLIYSVYPSRDYRLLEKRLHTLLPSGRWTGLADLPFSNPSARIQTKGLPESLLLGESPNGLLVLHSSGNGEWARLFQIEGDADELSSGTLRQKSDGSWRLYWREGAKRWTYGPPSGVGRDLPILTAPLKAGVIGEMSAISRHGEHLLLETERVWFVVKTETGAGEAKRVGLEVRRAWPPTATAIPPTSLWSYQGELASVYRPTGLRTLTVGDRSVVTWVVKEIGGVRGVVLGALRRHVREPQHQGRFGGPLFPGRGMGEREASCQEQLLGDPRPTGRRRCLGRCGGRLGL